MDSAQGVREVQWYTPIVLKWSSVLSACHETVHLSFSKPGSFLRIHCDSGKHLESYGNYGMRCGTRNSSADPVKLSKLSEIRDKSSDRSSYLFTRVKLY